MIMMRILCFIKTCIIKLNIYENTTIAFISGLERTDTHTHTMRIRRAALRSLCSVYTYYDWRLRV